MEVGGWASRKHFGLPGGVARSLSRGRGTGMLVARALPFSPKCFRAALPSISTGSQESPPGGTSVPNAGRYADLPCRHFFSREALELLLQNRMRISPSRLAPAMFWMNLDQVGEFTTLQSELFKRCIRRPLLDRAENSHRSVSVPGQSIRRTLHPLGL